MSWRDRDPSARRREPINRWGDRPRDELVREPQPVIIRDEPREFQRVSRGLTSSEDTTSHFARGYHRAHAPRDLRDDLPYPPAPKQAPPRAPNRDIGVIRSRHKADRERHSVGRGITSRNESPKPGHRRGDSRGSTGDIPSPPPAPEFPRSSRPIHSRDGLTKESQRDIRGRTPREESSGSDADMGRLRRFDRSRSRDEIPSPCPTPAHGRLHSRNERTYERHSDIIDLTGERGFSDIEWLDEQGRGKRGWEDYIPPPKRHPPPPPPPVNRYTVRDEPTRDQSFSNRVLRPRDETPSPPPAPFFLAQTFEEDEFSPESETRRVRGSDRALPTSRRESPYPKAAPELHRGSKSVHSEDGLIPERMSISPNSHGESSNIDWPNELGYDQALAVLWKDENFADVVVSLNEDKEMHVAYESINEPYDPSVTIGAHHLNSYLLMKNDIMILGNKYVENMIHTAGQIWSRIFQVEPPLIRVPETPCEFVYFKMQSYEDKVKVLKMCQNGSLQEKTQFMGRPTYVKDVCVAPLPLLLAQPGTRQEALDILMPMRKISYKDQISARTDLINKMLKDVVLKVRETLGCSPDSDEDMAHCFYDKPDVKDLVRMTKLAGYSRFNTIDLGYYHGEPAPGVRVYYGPDDAPKAFLLPLKDCAHISPAIIETTNELFRFLINKGFAIHDPWNCQGNLVKFRVMMNSFGRMIVTVELSEDDEFVESFESIFYHNDPKQALKGQPRPIYPPQDEPTVIPGYEFTRENSLEEVPPSRTLVKSGGLEQLKRIRPVLEEFHQNYGQQLRISGMFVTWYFVNERPVEWDRNSKIWHHVCGSDFIDEVIMDVTLFIYPNISCPHFPHIQAFPKILEEIVEITRVNQSSRVVVLSEYFFLAEFFGMKCSRTIFMKTEVTMKERTYLEQALHPGAVKFLSPLDKKRKIEDLEPGGDVVIIWGGVRNDEVMRSIAFANYRRVIFVRDGLKRGKEDKIDTFVALHQISKCLFPYMALAGAIAIDVEPHGYTMPALLAVFTRAPNAPKVPLVAALIPSISEVPIMDPEVNEEVQRSHSSEMAALELDQARGASMEAEIRRKLEAEFQQREKALKERFDIEHKKAASRPRKRRRGGGVGDSVANEKGKSVVDKTEKAEKACYNCQAYEHLSRDCPETQVCYKCRAYGHLSRDCPNTPTEKTKQMRGQCSGPSLPLNPEKACYNCQAYGHLSKDCPKTQACYKCRASGHLSRDCPNTPTEKTKQMRGLCSGSSLPLNPEKACYNCRAYGHLSRDCPKPPIEKTKQMRSQCSGSSLPVNPEKACCNCGAYGHLSRDCPNTPAVKTKQMRGQCIGSSLPVKPEKACYNCRAYGHLSRDCPETQACYKCRAYGHLSRDCPETPTEKTQMRGQCSGSSLPLNL